MQRLKYKRFADFLRGPLKDTRALHKVNDMLDGSMDSKRGRRYECVKWHAENFDCTPWKGEDPLIGTPNYKAMWDFHVAVCRSVANWIARDEESRLLMWFIDNHKSRIERQPNCIEWWGFSCVRYTCEELSYWHIDEEGEPHQPHGLAWTDFDICSYQSSLTREQNRFSRDILRNACMHVR